MYISPVFSCWVTYVRSYKDVMHAFNTSVLRMVSSCTVSFSFFKYHFTTYITQHMYVASYEYRLKFGILLTSIITYLAWVLSLHGC